MKKLTHVSQQGKANMVDVSDKPGQLRIARAQGHIRLRKETLVLIRENGLKKGDVLSIAEFAGIQAAKKTSELIPLCHPLQLTKVEVVANPDKTGVMVSSMIKCVGQTGVEMEALTAVNIALLTIYDMCKAVDKEMVMDAIKLIEKTKQDL
jgi:cyclic pyranopterin monophosphate synthase